MFSEPWEVAGVHGGSRGWRRERVLLMQKWRGRVVVPVIEASAVVVFAVMVVYGGDEQTLGVGSGVTSNLDPVKGGSSGGCLGRWWVGGLVPGLW